MTLSDKITLQTQHGEFFVTHFVHENEQCLLVHLPTKETLPFVRLQSACVFSESFGGTDCDCALQLNSSLAQVAREGGVVVYSWEEGRGVGIGPKIRAIQLEQSEGIDTREAYERLGYPADLRDYRLAARALKELAVGTHIRLATRNPGKIQALEDEGFTVERVGLEYDKTPVVRNYLNLKRKALGHYGD